MGQQFSAGLPQTGLIWQNNVAVEKGLSGLTWLTDLSTTNINPNEDALRKPDGVAPHWLSEFNGYRHKCLIVDVGAKTMVDGLGETFNITARCFPGSVTITNQQYCTTTVVDANTIQVVVEMNGGVERTVSFTVNGAGFTEAVSFTQSVGHVDYLNATALSNSSWAAHTETVNVSSCSTWSVESFPNWVNATKSNSTTLTVTYLKNQSYAARSGSITLVNIHGTRTSVEVFQESN